jgi:LPS O-antigen subunit length determinant protein (WzzB/FepE family)
MTEQMEQQNLSQPNQNNDEIDLVDLLRKLWVKRKFILTVTGIFLLIGFFVALFSPVSYTASCTVVPQSGENKSGGLSGVAAMMGVNLGTAMMSEGTLSPHIYPEIVKSVPFTLEIMQTLITTNRSNGKTITLYEYYTNKQYQDKNLLGSIKKYTLGLPGVLLGSLKKENPVEETAFFTDSVTVYSLNEEEKEVYKTIQNAIQVSVNPKEGYVSLSYSFPEAKPAAEVTDNLYRTLEKYVTTFKSEKLEDNLQFVEESYETARQDFLQAQSRLTAFQDANRGLATATARSTEMRLQSEFNIAFSVYSELAKQREQARIAVKENQTILTLVNPAVVPHEKSAPRRSIILVGFLFLGIATAFGWVQGKPYVQKIFKEIEQN